MATIREDYSSEHFRKGGTGITNFIPEQLSVYERAIDEAERVGVLQEGCAWISDQPMFNTVGCNYYSLHITQWGDDLGPFWRIFERFRD